MVQTPVFPIPVQNDIFDNPDNDSVNNDDSDVSDNQFSFLKELKDRARKRDIDHEGHFRYKVLNESKNGYEKSRLKKQCCKIFGWIIWRFIRRL